MPDRHPLAQLESVPLHNLRGQVWANCPPGTGPHEALVQLLRSHGSTDMDVRYWWLTTPPNCSWSPRFPPPPSYRAWPPSPSPETSS